jgi:hypothetical protein
VERIGSSNYVEHIIPNKNYESSANESANGQSTPEPQRPTKSQLKHPTLHIHSISYPTWPSLSDTDPAIELIRSIKEELKKFDPKVS